MIRIMGLCVLALFGITVMVLGTMLFWQSVTGEDPSIIAATEGGTGVVLVMVGLLVLRVVRTLDV